MTSLIRALVVAAAVVAAVLTSGDSMRVQCDQDRYYDPTARECTPCTQICNPGRGTDYLCEKHIDVCNATIKRFKLQTRRQPSVPKPYLNDVTLTSITVLITCSLIAISIFACVLYRTRICTRCVTDSADRKTVREVNPVLATSDDLESILCVSSSACHHQLQQQTVTLADDDDDGNRQRLICPIHTADADATQLSS